jgi:hypothetical protein
VGDAEPQMRAGWSALLSRPGATLVGVLAGLFGWYWGDVPTWVAGVGTVAAFAATWRTLRVQQAQLKQVKLDQDERDTERIQEQARLIAAWYVGVEPILQLPAQAVDEPTAPEPRYAVHVRYCNTSAQPVYDATVLVKSGSGVEPDTYRRELGVIAPGENGQIHVLTPLTVPPDSAFFTLPPVEVRFRDDGGRTWLRHDKGHLEELGVDGEVPPLPGTRSP